ncbi:MAG: inorganic diphosphatase [Alphaproteobacteria bacterium]|nr:inorganic diphosphatase [Alphaproteobacteria bacterium]TAD89356.1 MAG: inorganic diphosphatase [Alphaproteobacteria bacterium]
MDISKVAVGKNPPKDFNVIIEIPMGGEPVKYELDKESGALVVDRFLHTAMYYPGNYGFVPHTLAEDGDPLDVLVIGRHALVPGCIVPCRAVGVLLMEDDGGPDEKVLAVPIDKLHPFYAGINTWQDLPPILIEQIAHFFKHYKDLEKGKWVTIARWGGVEEAERLLLASVARYNKPSEAA